MTKDSTEAPAEELCIAGAVADRATAEMLESGVSLTAAASALLGGAMSLLARDHDDHSIVRILMRAIESVRAGYLRHATVHAGHEHRDGPET